MNPETPDSLRSERLRTLVVLLLFVGLVLGACGGDGEDPSAAAEERLQRSPGTTMPRRTTTTTEPEYDHDEWLHERGGDRVLAHVERMGETWTTMQGHAGDGDVDAVLAECERGVEQYDSAVTDRNTVGAVLALNAMLGPGAGDALTKAIDSYGATFQACVDLDVDGMEEHRDNATTSMELLAVLIADGLGLLDD